MNEDTVEVSRSDLLAVSRLLWSIGAEESTSHQHRVDCWHWDAHLDHAAGMPAHPTDEGARAEMVAFYTAIQERLAQHIEALRGSR